ncbi:sulfur transferase domain-containing protein [Lysobacter sp. CCNWLW3]|uniref:beta-lactamase hydrolase domain-containing protein n=1 Tax=unclassified Lysobacter TaxID=2635362 RepID=UPI002FD1A1FF
MTSRLPIAVFSLFASAAVAACATTPAPHAAPPVAGAVSPTPGVYAAGRIAAADIERLRAAGIRQVIDLTPDDETPDFDEAAAVRRSGLAYSNLALRGAADLTRDNAIAFDALMRSAQRPTLVHCASGNRVGAMAALRAAWIEGRSADEAVAIGKAWGLKGLESEVRLRIEAGPERAGRQSSQRP